jgi:hypothetical protein
MRSIQVLGKPDRLATQPTLEGGKRAALRRTHEWENLMCDSGFR